jgi:hypothetical protein
VSVILYQGFIRLSVENALLIEYRVERGLVELLSTQTLYFEKGIRGSFPPSNVSENKAVNQAYFLLK